MPETLPISERFLDVKDCARILKLSTRSFYDFLRTGTGPPYIKLGPRYRIRHKDLMRWALKHKDNKCS